MRRVGMFALALGILLLPLAASQDFAFFSGSCAVAGNGPGGPGGPGGDPGDGGGNAGAGKGGSKGGGKSDKGDLYGDMIYIKRDAFGVPVTVPLEGEDGIVNCDIPIAWDGTDWQELPMYGELGYDPTVPEAEADDDVPSFCLQDEYVLESAGFGLQRQDRDQVRIKAHSGDKNQDRVRDRDRIHDHLLQLWQMHQSAASGPAWRSSLEDTDGELGACDMITVCANNAQEVDLGRLSVLRAPERVMDKSRDEVIKALLKSSGPDSVTLDPSGRLTVDGVTFDSPLVNLALYREFHKFWQLQDTNQVPSAYFVPGSNSGLFNANFDPNYGAYIAMAFGLSAGADKAGAGVDVDVVSRVNSILYLPTNEYHVDQGQGYVGFPETLSKEIEGVTRYFVDYSDFEYVREDVWTGCIMFDYFDEGTQAWVMNHPMNVIDILYPDGLGGDEPQPGDTVSNIGGFALAADDARRVLVFVHDLGDAALRGRVDAVFQRNEEWCP
jgi:hypothetical protein